MQGETEAGELRDFGGQGLIAQPNYFQENFFCGSEQNGFPKRRTSLVIIFGT